MFESEWQLLLIAIILNVILQFFWVYNADLANISELVEGWEVELRKTENIIRAIALLPYSSLSNII